MLLFLRPRGREQAPLRRMQASYTSYSPHQGSCVGGLPLRARHFIGSTRKDVGTTSVRALETVFQDVPDKYNGETNLFIYPGYEFKVVDLMITNFHLPKSSLLMLVSAFIGHQEMHRVYQTAVKERYRFLSYGDAMLLTKK
jgi:S-adenosylmethionine:tRNA-ribosyltransferase-isomerase (queuine synthetase)